MKTIALAILACLVSGCDQPHSDKNQPLGRYQIAATPKGDVWRIDTATGNVSFCASMDSGSTALTCYATREGP